MSTDMKLYEIANQYQEAINYLDSDWIDLKNEEEKDVIKEKLDEIKDTLQVKAFNVAKYVNHLRSNTETIDREIERLEKIKKSYSTREQSLIDYLKFNMESCGIEKIDSPLFKISLEMCPPKIDISDTTKIPEEYIKTKTVKELDKRLMLEHIRQGVIIEGVTTIQNKRLEIK